MDEKKQIEEMAKEIGKIKERIYRGVVCVGERRTTPRHSALIAKHLIKIGYCKQEGKEMIIKIKLDEGAKMPTKAHSTDAGFDIYARDTQIIPAKESAKFDTGVHIELPVGSVGMLKSKSGLNVKHGITSEGVIDVGYTGSIVVKLYNNSGYDYTVNAGDKITQLVIMPILTPELTEVDTLEETERGNGGFGSTGR